MLTKHKRSPVAKHGRGRRISEASNTKQANKSKDSRKAFMDRMVEKWSAHEAGEGLDELYVQDKNGARNTCVMLEMQENYFRNGTRLDETTLSNEFQTTPENVLRIIRIGTANRNRGRFFTEWPMTTTDDSIYIVEKTRAQSLRGATAGENLHENLNDLYATESNEQSIGTGNAVLTNFTDTLGTVPVIRFSVQIVVGGVLLGNDDGNGVISGTNINASTSVVNYDTGVVNLDFVVAPAIGLDVLVVFNWDSEAAANFNEIGDVNIKVTRKRFEARPNPLGYSYSRMVELTLGTSGLGDVEDMLVRAVGDEHAMRQDLRAIQLGKRVASSNPIETFDTDFANVGEESDFSQAQRISSKLSEISGKVYNDIKRGTLNKGIVGQGVLTYLRKHRKWEEDESQPRVGGSFYAGKLNGMEIFATASGTDGVLGDNQMLLTYKNDDDQGDTAIAFGVLTEMVAALDFPEFYRKGNIATVEDSLVINSKLVRLLELQNL